MNQRWTASRPYSIISIANADRSPRNKSEMLTFVTPFLPDTKASMVEMACRKLRCVRSMIRSRSTGIRVGPTPALNRQHEYTCRLHHRPISWLPDKRKQWPLTVCESSDGIHPITAFNSFVISTILHSLFTTSVWPVLAAVNSSMFQATTRTQANRDNSNS